jgi:hypothetical protein
MTQTSLRFGLSWRLLQLVAIVILQVGLGFHGDHSRNGVQAFDFMLKQPIERVASPAASPAAPALVILGDSTVDVGVNNYLITPVKCQWPPYGRDYPTHQPTGRFCNGKLIGDFLGKA